MAIVAPSERMFERAVACAQHGRPHLDAVYNECVEYVAKKMNDAVSWFGARQSGLVGLASSESYVSFSGVLPMWDLSVEVSSELKHFYEDLRSSLEYAILALGEALYIPWFHEGKAYFDWIRNAKFPIVKNPTGFSKWQRTFFPVDCPKLADARILEVLETCQDYKIADASRRWLGDLHEKWNESKHRSLPASVGHLPQNLLESKFKPWRMDELPDWRSDAYMAILLEKYRELRRSLPKKEDVLRQLWISVDYNRQRPLIDFLELSYRETVGTIRALNLSVTDTVTRLEQAGDFPP